MNNKYNNMQHNIHLLDIIFFSSKMILCLILSNQKTYKQPCAMQSTIIIIS